MFDGYAHFQRRREFILDRNGIGIALGMGFRRLVGFFRLVRGLFRKHF